MSCDCKSALLVYRFDGFFCAHVWRNDACDEQGKNVTVAA